MVPPLYWYPRIVGGGLICFFLNKSHTQNFENYESSFNNCRILWAGLRILVSGWEPLFLVQKIQGCWSLQWIWKFPFSPSLLWGTWGEEVQCPGMTVNISWSGINLILSATERGAQTWVLLQEVSKSELSMRESDMEWAGGPDILNEESFGAIAGSLLSSCLVPLLILNTLRTYRPALCLSLIYLHGAPPLEARWMECSRFQTLKSPPSHQNTLHTLSHAYTFTYTYIQNHIYESSLV